MMALLDTPQDLDQCAKEMGCETGQLLTPLTRYRLRDPKRRWAMDNGGFSDLNIKGFLALLEREKANRATCLFVAVPDIVGSARRTLEVFHIWKGRLSGWPLALVCQDGQEDLPIPWDDIAAVFIGGSTKWKCSPQAGHIVKAAKALDKWAHFGRVNHGIRWQHCEDLGADSADGTGLARYTHMRKGIKDRHRQATIDGVLV